MPYYDQILSLLRGINVTNNILIVCSPRVSLGVTVASLTKKKKKKSALSLPHRPFVCHIGQPAVAFESRSPAARTTVYC